jgi:hypothetical protein
VKLTLVFLMLIIKIATDFSTAPGPRHIHEGDYSGEQFRESVLIPRLREAIANGEAITIDLDGTSGIAPSFLEESFGGLIRERGFTLAQIDSCLIFKSEEMPIWKDDIRRFLTRAEENRNKSKATK